MNRPKDISPKAFNRMVDENKGLVLVSSKRVGTMRYFQFVANSKHPVYPHGDIVEIPLRCRYGRTAH